MNYGMDVLGGVKYPQVVAKIPREFGIGVFWDTFGNAKNLIATEAKRRPFIRVQGIWSDSHSFSSGNETKAIQISKELENIAVRNPNCKIYYSPYCEHRKDSRYMTTLLNKIQPHCPHVTLINCPLKEGGIVEAEFNEIHGKENPRYRMMSYSFDGTSAEDYDVELVKKKFENAEYFMFWSPRFNGRWEDNDKTPRPQRKGWPDDKMMKSILHLATAKGNTSLPKKYLWKSHSENHGKGDSRAEKPVAIIPVKADFIELKKGSTTVHKMKYYGPYTDGRSRYYATKWGYELGKVDVWVKGKKQGNINAGFRDGSFR